MSDCVITVENLSKRYIIGHQKNQYDGLRHQIEAAVRHPWRWLGARSKEREETSEEFWALKDVSFEVKKGEVVGIIGRNGAGKSTLLKILSRITEPTQGRIHLKGRVASLLEVGTGFHPDLTGRENIFLNGAILGMTQVEIRRKFDEIVAFSEIEKFLDTPVKHYSSGMYVRLAFAVAAHLEPEILIVDEVLAVGDAQFQKKCLGKMQSVAQSEGRTILFVSHNISAVRNLCTCCINLEQGKVVAIGLVEDGIAHYLHTDGPDKGVNWSYRSGDGRIKVTDFWVERDNSERMGTIVSGEPCTLVFAYQNAGARNGDNVDVGFGLHTLSGERLLLLYASYLGPMFTRLHPEGEFRCRLPALPLATGRYAIYCRIEINGIEADYPRDGVGWIDVEEIDFYGTGRSMGQHGHAHAPYLIKGEWAERPIGRDSNAMSL